MHYILKTTSVAFFSMMILSAAFGQHSIVLELNSAGKLIDPGTTLVKPGDFVVWSIKPNEKIDYFRIEGANHPFNSFPSAGNRRQERGDVRPKEHRRDWKYTIIYKRTDKISEDQIDPKIAIIPPGGGSITNFILIFLLGALVPLIMAIFYHGKWKGAEDQLKKLS